MPNSYYAKNHVLFVVSIFNYYQEVQPTVEAFLNHGWRVTAVIGWMGLTADKATVDLTAMGCRVFRLPDDMSYQDNVQNLYSL
jgi:hypothetical protein